MNQKGINQRGIKRGIKRILKRKMERGSNRGMTIESKRVRKKSKLPPKYRSAYDPDQSYDTSRRLHRLQPSAAWLRHRASATASTVGNLIIDKLYLMKITD